MQSQFWMILAAGQKPTNHNGPATLMSGMNYSREISIIWNLPNPTNLLIFLPYMIASKNPSVQALWWLGPKSTVNYWLLPFLRNGPILGFTSLSPFPRIHSLNCKSLQACQRPSLLPFQRWPLRPMQTSSICGKSLGVLLGSTWHHWVWGGLQEVLFLFLTLTFFWLKENQTYYLVGPTGGRIDFKLLLYHTTVYIPENKG